MGHRGIEDPVSALGPTLFGGSWTRLALAEMALRTCMLAIDVEIS
jgi:hypothetical protein